MNQDTTYSDRELFKRISQGDQQAYKIFFDSCFVKVSLYASRILQSDLWAEEIVQDVFLKLWTIRESLGNIENPVAFLNTMIANRARDQLKHREHEFKLQHHLSYILKNAAANTTQDHIDYRISEKLFEKAVQQLPRQRATIFRMRHEKGLSYDEISREMNISKYTVRNLLNLAMQNIRAYLLKHGDISGIGFVLLNYFLMFLVLMVLPVFHIIGCGTSSGLR